MKMRLCFGQDMEVNLQNALSVMTPNIIRAAQSGSQRELLSSLLGDEANSDGMSPADNSSFPLHPSITSIKLCFYLNIVCFC